MSAAALLQTPQKNHCQIAGKLRGRCNGNKYCALRTQIQDNTAMTMPTSCWSPTLGFGGQTSKYLRSGSCQIRVALLRHSGFMVASSKPILPARAADDGRGKCIAHQVFHDVPVPRQARGPCAFGCRLGFDCRQLPQTIPAAGCPGGVIFAHKLLELCVCVLARVVTPAPKKGINQQKWFDCSLSQTPRQSNGLIPRKWCTRGGSFSGLCGNQTSNHSMEALWRENGDVSTTLVLNM